MSDTTKSGYHLRNTELKIYYVKEELLFLGVETIKTPQRNSVQVYDRERTICDIIKIGLISRYIFKDYRIISYMVIQIWENYQNMQKN